jgi:hypothetical protein
MGTEKISHELKLDTNGILSVNVKEVGGYGKHKLVLIDIRKWL